MEAPGIEKGKRTPPSKILDELPVGKTERERSFAENFGGPASARAARQRTDFVVVHQSALERLRGDARRVLCAAGDGSADLVRLALELAASFLELVDNDDELESVSEHQGEAS